MAGEDVEKVDAEKAAESIVHVLQALYTAARSILIYPPENPTIVNMLDSAYEALMELVPAEGSLDLSVMREKLLVNGETLDDALQKRRIIQSFVEMLEQRKLSSVTFWAGLTKDELREFLAALATKGRAAESEDASQIYEEMQERGIQHVEVDEQVYVAISKREKVVDARAAVAPEEDIALKALKDEVFSRFIAGEVHLSDIDPAMAKEIMSDPEKMVAMVQSMISAEGWDTKVELLPYRIDQTRMILERLAELIGHVEDPQVRSKLSFELSRITSQVDAPQLTEMLLRTSGKEAARASELPEVVMPLLGDVKLEEVAVAAIEEYLKLSQTESGDDWPTSRMMALRSVLDSAVNSASPEVTERLSAAIQQAGVDPQKEEEAAAAAGKELAGSLMSGADMSLCDGVGGPTLMVAAARLFENNMDDLGSKVTEKLTERFMMQSADAKPTAARQLWEWFNFLKKLGKESFASGLIDEVSKVLDKEKGALAAYTGLTESMEEVAGSLGTESVQAGIEALGLGTGGPVSAKTMESLMASDTGQVVQAVFESGDKSAQEAISKALLGMGERAIPTLIDTAQDSTDEETLWSVADSLSQFRSDPTPRIAARFSQALETFQLLNLLKLLGRVGNEASAASLTPLLAGEDEEIKLEAIHVLGSLSGKNAMHMLINESAELDVALKAAAVKELRRFHDYTAVKRLIEIITPKKKGEVAEHDAVMTAACRSLGEMRATQAAPLLVDIALGGRKHEPRSETLRAAAAAALGAIGGEDGSKALKKLLKDPSLLVRSTAKKALGYR